MSPEERLRLQLSAAIARASIRALGMHAENLQRQHVGDAMAYTEAAFDALIIEEGIGHNDVIETLNRVS